MINSQSVKVWANTESTAGRRNCRRLNVGMMIEMTGCVMTSRGRSRLHAAMRAADASVFAGGLDHGLRCDRASGRPQGAGPPMRVSPAVARARGYRVQRAQTIAARRVPPREPMGNLGKLFAHDRMQMLRTARAQHLLEDPRAVLK